ncbi:MAG: twin-arginine translocation signal domain-containing protein [Eggerthellaceae bacterium]|nr:twin-arginine translocation signal domain-containing protein [Eggerthellaceae bacterium]
MASKSPKHIAQDTRKRPSVDNVVYAGDSPAKTLISRRKFLYGAIGAGAVAAVGIGAVALNSRNDDNEITYLEVPEQSVTALASMEVVDDYETRVSLIASHDLPYGTLIWCNSDEAAACLLPCDTGKPLTQIGLLYLGSGTVNTLLERAIGTDRGFEVYDVRATTTGVIWTEANVLEGTWRIYTARIAGGNLESIALADEGDETYDTPTLGMAGSYAFWQLLPKSPNSDLLPSLLKRIKPGAKTAETVYENARRMATVPYCSARNVTITPRIDSSSVYYQLTCIDSETGEITDTCTLPQGMKPLEAGYGKTGFMFSFENIYNYGGGIANLGTYCPMKLPARDGYSDVNWFSFARTPSAAPAWAGDLLIVKSTYSVCGVDLAKQQYFAIDVDNGADDYGEYLASSGEHETFVTFSNIDHAPVDAEAEKACRVKIWRPLSAAALAANSAGSVDSDIEPEPIRPETTA